MIEKTIKIKHENGLHMRPAMMFIELAAKFECDVTVQKNDIVSDGKSIMEITMLGAACGEEIKITAKGKDEKEAVEALEGLIKGNFNNLSEVK